MVSPEDCGASIGVEKETIVFSQHNSTGDEVFVQLSDNEARNIKVIMRYEPRCEKASIRPFVAFISNISTCVVIASIKPSRCQLLQRICLEVESGGRASKALPRQHNVTARSAAVAHKNVIAQ